MKATSVKTAAGKGGNQSSILFLLGLLAVLAFILGSGYLSYDRTRTLQRDAAGVAQTHEVIIAISELFSLIKDAETGQRGYVMTGKESYLSPYREAVSRIQQGLDLVENLVADNPAQAEHMPKVRALTDIKLKELQETIDVRRKQGFEPALSIIVTNRGKEAMDDLRRILDTMDQAEQDLRAKNLSEMKSAYQVAILTTVAGVLLAAALSCMVAFLLYRADVLRRKEEWLQAGHMGLAAAVLGDLGIERLGQNILKFLATYLDAHVGIFYTREEMHYSLAASYGLPANAAFPRHIDAKDGLLGQAIQDARPFVVRNVPDGYLKVGSGLGRSNPRHLVVFPAVSDDVVQGVFELGFIHPLDDDTLRLLEQISKSVGVAIQSAHYRSNLQQLLEETQSQSEELQAQSEELRASNEELEEQSRNLLESQQRMEQQQQELEISNQEIEERARELERLNRKIKESGERVNAVVESALDGIIAIDERGTVQDFNQACERLFGYRADEVVGKNINMLMSEPYHSEHDGYLSRYMQTGDAHIIGTAGREVSGRRKDGSVFPMDLSVSMFRLSGVRYFSGTVRDLTLRKEAEGRLLKYQRDLEASSKYKSEFLANMSHELRTPLNSLLILARSLASNEDGNLTEEQIEEANIIHSGGMELLSLINDILDLSKVEAGKMSIVVDEVKIDSIVKRMEKQFNPVARESGISFNIRISDDIPDTIATDMQRVEQILKNLLSNAFKFTEEGSVTLEIALPKADIALQRNGLQRDGAVAFSVTDTGIGIDPSKLNDIFEAFQQEDGSTDRHYGGTGLGLTIARKFAHMLGGEIHVRSKKGAGSDFTLILPRSYALQKDEPLPEKTQSPSVSTAPVLPPLRPDPGPPPERAIIKAASNATGKLFLPDDRNTAGEKDKVLLIIEDDRDFAQTLMKMARKRGYKCLAAGDGKTGLLMAREQRISGIILDLKLPDIDGLNVLDHLKHDLKTRHIPVHIITGRAEVSNVVPLRKGAIGYLTKPVQAEDIEGAFTKIESLLESGIKRVLVVEDDKKTQAAIQSLLKKKDIEILCINRGTAALGRLQKERFDCVVLDLTLPDMDGFEWLEKMERQGGEAGMPPVIVYTARDLTEEENRRLSQYTGSIVIKGVNSSERLLDEVTLFLHSIESTLTTDQQAMIRMSHDPDTVLKGRTALLVDDDMRNTFALSKLLKKRGMNVLIADNGQMALEKLQQDKNIELVIMDIMMPVMDGYQAMREIRASQEHAHLPIIALTARAMPEEQERCMEAGANDYLTKPVDIDRLLTLLRVWLFRQEAA